MTDHLRTMSPAWHARQRRHRHNSFRGHARMCQQQMQGIISSDSATETAKQLALEIRNRALALEEALKVRVDLEECDE
jgi:hypothetical protein